MHENIDVQVRTSQLTEQRIVTMPRHDAATLAPGEALLTIERFALTANNVTYAAFGDSMRYWDFFPAEPGWGRVPVWGFATVEATGTPELRSGEKVYGFLPMSNELLVFPHSITDSSWIDAAAHRSELPAIYNQYVRVDADPTYSEEREPHQMVLRPLFMTSWLIADFLNDNAMFDAGRVIISSASSKTAVGTAYCLANDAKKSIEIVGVTSAGNREFVKKLGLYDTVVTYDEIGMLKPTPASVFVDIAGSGRIRHAIHAQLGENLRHSSAVGASHLDKNQPPTELPGPQPEFFFAPAQFQKRAAEIGAGSVMTQFAHAWHGFIQSSDAWLRIVELNGATAIQATFNRLLTGTVPPDEAYVLSFL